MEQRALKYTLPEAQNRPESGVAYRVHIQGPDGALCGFRGHSEAWWELVVDAEEMRSMVVIERWG